jgi:DNA-binding SARP family transcriptional activator
MWSSRVLLGRVIDAIARSFAGGRVSIVNSPSNRLGARLDGVLQVRLLGELEVKRHGATILSPPSQRPWALFAYLALSPRPLARADLAARFWPDVLDASARASLRSALWTLRRAVGEWLVVDRDRVGLCQDRPPWVDVREFERLAAQGRQQQALELCRGDLLEGLDDEWALAKRQRHRERVVELLEALAEGAQARGAVREALEWTRQQAERDPLDEAVHRRLMGRLEAAGERAAALRVYQSFSERLRHQLRVAPSPLTREVAERLRGGPHRAPARTRPAAPAPPTPLVGRGAELGELLDAWGRARAGAGTTAVVRGEAGIGKTRLTTELRARAAADGGLTAACAALDLGGVAPLSLWAELLRELLPALPAPPPESAWPDDLALLVSELPAHFGRGGRTAPGVAPDLQRTRLFEAVVALLAWASRDRTMLLMLEDIHAADRPSLELAGYAARRAAALPVMLVLTRRELPRCADADHIEQALRARGLLAPELTLSSLGPPALAELARSVQSLSDEQVTQVVRRADGNALLAVETARALANGVQDVAPSLRGSVRATLAPLSGEARELAELAAVAARPLEPAELEQLALRDVADASGRALQTGLLIATEGTFGFRHALLRDAVYADIPEPHRRAMHERWAAALVRAGQRPGALPRPAEAARHFRLAGRDAEAVNQLARAAVDARAVTALDQAAAYLEEAVAIAPERAELWLELGEIEAWRAQRERAETAFARGREAIEGGQPSAGRETIADGQPSAGREAIADERPLALARAWLARARAYHGPLCVPSDVLESSRAALELLERVPEPARAEQREALAACAWSEAVAGDADRAERLLAQLGVGEALDDLEAYDITHARAYALMRRGRFQESCEPSVAAAMAAVRAGRPDLAYGCWAAAAGAASAIGDHERALELIDRGRGTLEGKGLQSIDVHMLAARSFLLIRLERVAEARAASELEQRLAEQLDRPELLAMASHDRGLVALEAGDPAAAAELLGAALVEGAPVSRPLTRLARAQALTQAGSLDGAEDELRAMVLEPVRRSDFPDALVPRLARVQGLIALARGDRDLAEKRLRESVAGWESVRTRAAGAGAANITAVLADLGRPVVGLVEPERELARARADLAAAARPAQAHAVIP